MSDLEWVPAACGYDDCEYNTALSDERREELRNERIAREDNNDE